MNAKIYAELSRCLEKEQLVALATIIDGPGLGHQLMVWPDTTISGSAVLPPALLGDLGSRELNAAVAAQAKKLLSSFKSQRSEFQQGNQSVQVFIEVHPPRPQLVVIGAVHVAIPLVTFANTLGFRTLVVDPRTAFATPERFPHAHELITDWPDVALEAIGLHENTFLALLSHDPKLDLPALQIALRQPVRYIGALGSKKTHGKRVAALQEKGFKDEEIARIYNPIGLDLGGRRAEEIAVAVIAEMVAVNHGNHLS